MLARTGRGVSGPGEHALMAVRPANEGGTDLAARRRSQQFQRDAVLPVELLDDAGGIEAGYRWRDVGLRTHGVLLIHQGSQPIGGVN